MRRVLYGLICVVVGIGIGVSVQTGGEPQAMAQGVPSGNGDCNGDGGIDLTDVIWLLKFVFIPGAAPPEPIMDTECHTRVAELEAELELANTTIGECTTQLQDCQAALLGCTEDLEACLNAIPQLPATGQTKCYDDFAGDVTDCGDQWYPGQDGFYQAGCATEERFVDNGDDTVTDKCTGLRWDKWTSGFYSWQDALQYCEDLVLAGHDDWRLPNVRELQSIVDYGRSEPAIDSDFFRGALSNICWSSSTHERAPGYAWTIHFLDGGVFATLKLNDDECFVRAVRGGL